MFLFAIVYGGLTAVLFVALLAMKAEAPIHAIAWHMRHGNTVSYDGHLFHLPLYWYPDPDSRPGQFGLQHAQFGSVDFSHITLATEPQRLDGQTAQGKIAALAINLNKRHPAPENHWATETLQGRKLTFHCMMSSTDAIEDTFFCLAADSNLRLVTLSTGSSRTETLNILETSE